MRPSYANVTATLALVIALGGTSYAAIKIPKDSIGSRQVRDRSLNSGDLAPGAVGVGQVRIATSTPREPRKCFTNCEGTAVISAGVTCPEGTVVVGGGVTAPKANDARVFASQPAENGWTGKVRIAVAASPATIPDPTVYALCVKS